MNKKRFLYLLTSYLVLCCVISAENQTPSNCSIATTGVDGVCVEAEKCKSAQYEFETFNVVPTLCKIAAEKVLVCCTQVIDESQFDVRSRSENLEAKLINKEVSLKTKLRISEKKCRFYSSSVMESFNVYSALPQSEAIPITIEKCDFVNNQLIVGGKTAKRGQFPHMALLGWVNNNGNGFDWNCGGSLISEHFVLTATHCTFHKAYASTKPSIVRLGEHNINSHNTAKPLDVPIEYIVLHPDYKPGKKYHDIALLKLQYPIEINKYIRPACLWSKPIIEDKTAIVTGWGATEYKGIGSSILQYAILDIIDQERCNQIFSKTSDRRLLERGIIDGQLCAGKFEGGSDTCQGDSGGPIQIVSKANNCIYYVIGITSFGNGCGAVNSSAVYTRVDRYIAWIENNVWPNEK